MSDIIVERITVIKFGVDAMVQAADESRYRPKAGYSEIDECDSNREGCMKYGRKRDRYHI